MKIVADEQIPLVHEYFGEEHDVVLFPGRALSAQHVKDADIVLVRAVTRVDASLLKNSKVKFVGSATAGMDHMDTAWLSREKIMWSAAPGCNADAVAEYVVCVIAALQTLGKLTEKKLRAAVIGVGQTGHRVAEKLAILGFEVLQCDPLRAENEPHFISTSLQDIGDCDVISLHVPLTREGRYATESLIDADFLKKQKSNVVTINTSRGEVIDADTLKNSCDWIKCFDVWRNEPHVDSALIAATTLATPHIAGYSAQAKIRGTQMLYAAAVERNIIPLRTHSILFPQQTLSFHNAAATWHDIVLRIFDPRPVKQLLEQNPFDELRKTFLHRHEFAFTTIEDVKLNKKDETIIQQLKIGI